VAKVNKIEKGKSTGLNERKVGTRQLVEQSLIVCNADCTEKNYFKKAGAWINTQYKVAKGVKQDGVKFEYYCDPVAPMQLPQKIKNKIKANFGSKVFDIVWVIFDKDAIPTEQFNQAVKDLQKLSNKKTQYKVLWSNICFELWFLLHFDYFNVATDAKSYYKKLKEKIDQKYQKEDANIFDIIVDACDKLSGGGVPISEIGKGGVSKEQRQLKIIYQAMQRAKQLIESHKDRGENFADCDPCTTVYEFFEHYFDRFGLI